MRQRRFSNRSSAGHLSIMDRIYGVFQRGTRRRLLQVRSFGIRGERHRIGRPLQRLARTVDGESRRGGRKDRQAHIRVSGRSTISV